MFCWLKGTSFGREVVPEVCSTSAMSPDSAIPPWEDPSPAGFPFRSNKPAAEPEGGELAGDGAAGEASGAGPPEPEVEVEVEDGVVR